MIIRWPSEFLIPLSTILFGYRESPRPLSEVAQEVNSLIHYMSANVSVKPFFNSKPFASPHIGISNSLFINGDGRYQSFTISFDSIQFQLTKDAISQDIALPIRLSLPYVDTLRNSTPTSLYFRNMVNLIGVEVQFFDQSTPVEVTPSLFDRCTPFERVTYNPYLHSRDLSSYPAIDLWSPSITFTLQDLRVSTEVDSWNVWHMTKIRKALESKLV